MTEPQKAVAPTSGSDQDDTFKIWEPTKDDVSLQVAPISGEELVLVDELNKECKDKATIAKRKKKKLDRQFVRYREHCPLDGETWYWYIPFEKNEEELWTFQEAIAEVPFMELDLVTRIPESEVDILVKHTDHGYFPHHNKANGRFHFSNERDYILTDGATQSLLKLFDSGNVFGGLEITYTNDDNSNHHYVRLSIDREPRRIEGSLIYFIRWEGNEKELERIQEDFQFSRSFSRRYRMDLDILYRGEYVKAMCDRYSNKGDRFRKLNAILHYSQTKQKWIEERRNDYLETFLRKGGIQTLIDGYRMVSY